MCAVFRTISFAELPPGEVDDPGNAADSAPTVNEVLAHNAAWLTVCSNPLVPPASIPKNGGP